MSQESQPDISLLEFLDLSQVNCLNESQSHTLRSILESKKLNSSSEYLASDADEQLLLSIAFNQAVKVKSIVVQSSNKDAAPKMIKLLVNRPAIGFEDVEDAQGPDVAQVLDLSSEQVTKGTPIPLRFVRFQKVNSLHIFVASNQGALDESRIDAIDIIGTLVETTKDLSGLIPKDQ